MTAPDPAGFLDQDPTALVDPTELAEAGGYIPAPQDRRRQQVALALGAAFITIAWLMRQALAAEGPLDGPGAKAAAAKAWTTRLPLWVRLAVPAVRQAYSLGNVGEGLLSEDELTAMATKYVIDLGDYLEETSSAALADGFATQLEETNWNSALAWNRASQAWGLDSQQTRSYTRSVLTGKADPRVDPVPAAARALVDRLLMQRGDAVMRTEVPRAIETGKALAWIQLQADGRIGPDARRVWVTSGIERHCAFCLFLHGQAVPLGESFVGPNGERIYAPGAHPRCECETRLDDPGWPEEVEKSGDNPDTPYWDARGGDPKHPGRFSRATKPVAERTTTVDPTVAAIQQQAREVTAEPADPFAALRGGSDPFASLRGGGDAFSALRGDPPDPFGALRNGSGSSGLDALRRGLQPGDRDAGGREIGPDGKPRRKRTIHQLLIIKKPSALAEAEEEAAEFIDRSAMFAMPMSDPARVESAMREEPAEQTLWRYGETIDFDILSDLQQSLNDWARSEYEDLGIHSDYHSEDTNSFVPPWGEHGQASVIGGDLWNAANFGEYYDELEDEWQSIQPNLQRTFDYVLDNHDSITPRLTGDDLATIYAMAGWDLDVDSEDARARIDRSAERLLGGFPDQGLAQAYGDWVTYQRPELAGSEGAELLAVVRPIEDEVREWGTFWPHEGLLPDPSIPGDQLMVFTEGLHPGATYHDDGHRTRADLQGSYRVVGTHYHSALHERPRYVGRDGYNVIEHDVVPERPPLGEHE